MATDKNGKTLAVGDFVTVKGVVAAIDDSIPDATVTVALQVKNPTSNELDLEHYFSGQVEKLGETPAVSAAPDTPEAMNDYAQAHEAEQSSAAPPAKKAKAKKPAQAGAKGGKK